MQDSDTLDQLASIGTATLTMLMLKQGLRAVHLHGARPLADGPAVAGPAFTIRFAPAREDLSTAASLAGSVSTRHAIEAAGPGAVVVVDALGRSDAGVVGDILTARMQARGIRALVTDGAVRDVRAVRDLGFPIWSAGAAAPPSIATLHVVEWQVPIACGGVQVRPEETVVADADGAIVVPDVAVAGLLRDGPAQNDLEDWVLEQVRSGHPLPGLYPPDEDTRARYEVERSR